MSILIHPAGGALGEPGPPALIQSSCEFRNDLRAMLRKRLPKDGDRRLFSMSIWHRRLKTGGEGGANFMGWAHQPNSTGNETYFGPTTGGVPQIVWQENNNGRIEYFKNNSDLSRDVTGWCHTFIVWDTNNGTASQRMRWWNNGREVANANGAAIPSGLTTRGWLQVSGSGTSLSYVQGLGGRTWNTATAGHWDGPMARVEMWEGGNTPLDPSAVGFFDSNGTWQAKAYEGPDGDYGAFGFRCLFDDVNHFGKDDREGETWGATYTASQWDGNVGNWNFFDGKISSGVANQAIRVLGEQFEGDFEVRYSYEAGSFPRLGVYDVAEDATFNPGNESGGMQNMTNSWWHTNGSSANILYGGVTVQNWSTEAQQVISLRRVSGVFTVHRNDALIHTYSQAFNGPVRLCVATGAATLEYHQLEWNNGQLLAGSSFFDPVGDFTTASASADIPTNAFAVLNDQEPLLGGAERVINRGGLYFSTGNSASNAAQTTIRLPRSGKIQWAGAWTLNTTMEFGIVRNDQGNAYQDFYSYRNDGRKNSQAGGYESYGVAWTLDEQILVLVDIDAGEISFKTGGADQGVAFSGIDFSVGQWFAWVYKVGAGNNGDAWVDFGQRGTFELDTGYSFLNAQAVAFDIADGQSHFDTLLWTGDDTSPRDVTGLLLDSNISIVKNRTASADFYLGDTVRGQNLNISPSSANLEFAATAANGGGVDLPIDGGNRVIGGVLNRLNVNESGNNYLGWNWVTGQIPGFAIVTYTGDGIAGRGIPHGLNAEPHYIAVKNLDDAGTNWAVYHVGADSVSPENYVLVWNNNDGRVAAATWNNQRPDATNFYANNSGAVNKAGDRYVAYVWASVPGFSYFGRYVGNGNSSDGPYITTDFLPALTHFKRADGTGNWQVHDGTRDPQNPLTSRVTLNVGDQESQWDLGDYMASGIKLRTSLDINTNAAANIVCAWAQHPFRNARSR